MPKGDEHLAKYRKNKKLLDSKEMDLNENSKHYEWIITISFYSALHLIEKEFFEDSSIIVDHSSDHKQRSDVMRKTRRFRNILTNYEKLKTACWKARYDADIMSAKQAKFALENLEIIEKNFLK